MTVNTNPPVSGPHVADGVQTSWQFDWKVFEAEHVSIVVRSADGTTTTTYTSNITVANEYLRNDAVGFAVFPAVGDPVEAGSEVYVVRNVPFRQARRIGNQGGFYPQTHEDALDELAMQIQQINEIAGRSLTVAIGDDPPDIASIYAAEVAAGVSAGLAAGSASAASISEGNALAYRNKAEEWAENPEDDEVEPGKFSAKHWAAKAEQVVLDGLVDGSVTIAKLASDVSDLIASKGVPLGATVHSAIDLTYQGYLLLDGSPITPLHPDLRNAFLAAGSPFGMSGSDPLLPDEVTAARFRRAANGSIPLGTVQDDQMQVITGSVKVSSADPNSAGAFSYNASGPNQAGRIEGTNTNTTGVLNFSSANSPGARAGDETRPKSIAYLPYIKAFGAITIEGMADLSQLLNAIATEAEAILGTNNTKLMTPLRTWQSGAARDARLLHVRDQKSAGVEGGASSAGIQKRTLNTTVTANISGASLSGASEVTLPAGKYRVQARAPAYAARSHQLFLRTSAGVTLIDGTTEFNGDAGTYAQTASFLFGELNLASATTVQLDHYIQIAKSGNGLGVITGNAGRPAVYAELMIWKVD